MEAGQWENAKEIIGIIATSSCAPAELEKKHVVQYNRDHASDAMNSR